MYNFQLCPDDRILHFENIPDYMYREKGEIYMKGEALQQKVTFPDCHLCHVTYEV